jgi:peptidoglycan/LPS O-acetylase OafA/YrhL
MVPAKPKPFPRFPELDGLRGIAVLMVFFHHITLPDALPWHRVQTFLKGVGEPGRSGVDVFFVLSGFLITSILLRERANVSYYRDFYWKRVLRVLPLYLLVLALIAIIVPDSLRYVLLAVVFLANFASVLHINLVSPFWSLAVEEQFYLVWPTVVRRRSTKAVLRFAVGVAATSFLLRVAFAMFGHYNYYLTFLRCDALALGAMLACRFRQSQDEGWAFSSESRKLWVVLCLGLAAAVAANTIPHGDRLIPQFVNLELTGVTLACCGLIGLSIAHTNSRWLAVLRSPALTFFGLISYAFYVIHVFVIEAYDHFSPSPSDGNNRAYAVRMAATFAVAILLSLLSRYAIELPALSLRRRVLSHPEPPAETELPILELHHETEPTATVAE